MKGFVVFEVAPPWRWVPKYERDKTVTFGKFHRFIWLYFSITFVFNMKWTEFIGALMKTDSKNKPRNGCDEHESNLGI